MKKLGILLKYSPAKNTFCLTIIAKILCTLNTFFPAHLFFNPRYHRIYFRYVSLKILFYVFFVLVFFFFTDSRALTLLALDHFQSHPKPLPKTNVSKSVPPPKMSFLPIALRVW